MNVRAAVAESAPAGAFDSFYRRELAGQVRRAALIVGSDELANDIVHDAMVEVYRRWVHLATPGAYLNRAVLNGCREATRKAAVQRRLLPRLFERAPQPDGDGALDDILRGLPFHQRAAVVLRFCDGLTTAEIAGALSCAPGSVGPWIDRALKKMRKVLQ
jgi:RNA polymerase sigma factor (sigma-70 family)